MKIYPYTTDDGIIELVRKDELDAVVAELEREVAENTDLRQRLHDRAVELAKIKQERVELWQEIAAAKHGDSGYAVLQERHEQEISKWQALAEMLAGYLKMIDVYPADFTSPELFYWNAKNKALIALAAYESTKSGNLPDTLAEAVKRMEAVTDGAIEAAYWDTGSWTRNVRACLIQAAKGESV